MISVFTQCLNEFKTDTATAQFIIRIAAIVTFWIQNGYSFWQNGSRSVVVANDKIDVSFFGIGHMIDGFNPTIQGDNQRKTIVVGIINSLERDAVAFVITVGNIRGDIRIKRFQIGGNERNRRGSIHIIITKN